MGLRACSPLALAFGQLFVTSRPQTAPLRSVSVHQASEEHALATFTPGRCSVRRSCVHLGRSVVVQIRIGVHCCRLLRCRRTLTRGASPMLMLGAPSPATGGVTTFRGLAIRKPCHWVDLARDVVRHITPADSEINIRIRIAGTTPGPVALPNLTFPPS